MSDTGKHPSLCTASNGGGAVSLRMLGYGLRAA
jgi:hypothetical protein